MLFYFKIVILGGSAYVAASVGNAQERSVVKLNLPVIDNTSKQIKER
jgi:hypothetical protein